MPRVRTRSGSVTIDHGGRVLSVTTDWTDVSDEIAQRLRSAKHVSIEIDDSPSEPESSEQPASFSVPVTETTESPNAESSSRRRSRRTKE